MPPGSPPSLTHLTFPLSSKSCTRFPCTPQRKTTAARTHAYRVAALAKKVQAVDTVVDVFAAEARDVQLTDVALTDVKPREEQL